MSARERCSVCGDEHGVCYDCSQEVENDKRRRIEAARIDKINAVKTFIIHMSEEDFLEIMAHWIENKNESTV